jgi:hypothetical protein
MIGAMLARFSGRAVLVALLVCLGGYWFMKGIRRIDAMIETARTEARAGRDAHWRGEIAKANAEAEVERARLALNSSAADAAARDQIERLAGQVSDMEKANASLPGAGACGLGRERVRLLAR